MIRSIIIDDETMSANTLRHDLELYCPEIAVVGVSYTAKDGLLMIKNENPDLVFLDVQMPWMNGFEMLDFMDEINFQIIFTTAHDQFAAKAFRLSAVDYLLKPIDKTELKDAIKKAHEKIEGSKGIANIENLIQNLKHLPSNQRIALPNKDGYEFVETSQIIYCQAEGAYTKVFLETKKNILVSKSLGDIEELLPVDFFVRIHHSTIVNINFITHFVRTDGGYVKLQSGMQLPVSKSKKENLLEILRLK